MLPALTGKDKAEFAPLAAEPPAARRQEARPHFFRRSGDHGYAMLVMTSTPARCEADIAQRNGIVQYRGILFGEGLQCFGGSRGDGQQMRP